MARIDYKSCALSAARSKIAYMGSKDLFELWENVNDESNIAYHVFKDVVAMPKYYTNNDSHVDAYTWIQGKTLHIVFRGTEGLDDAKIDLMVLRSPLFPGNKNILVHNGFLKQFISIADLLLETIYESKNMDIDTVHFSGHSLGAALATLAAGYFSPILREHGYKIKCHTFGGPRVGNSGFVDWWSGKVDESYRVLNWKDPVPLLPVNGYYKHIEGGLEVNNKCEVTILGRDISWFMRILYLPFDIYYRNPVANHACNLYIKRMLTLADWDLDPSSL